MLKNSPNETLEENNVRFNFGLKGFTFCSFM